MTLTPELLRTFFPFNEGEIAFCTKMLRAGKLREFIPGEKTCEFNQNDQIIGLVISGQFLSKERGETRDDFELMLKPGCFVGLTADRTKRIILSNITVQANAVMLIWKRSDFLLLANENENFQEGIILLKKAAAYQRDWDIPGINDREPLLAIYRQSGFYFGFCTAAGLLALLLSLWVSGKLFDKLALAPIIAILCCIGVIVFLAKSYNYWKNEYLFVTPDSVVHTPKERGLNEEIIRTGAIRYVRAKLVPGASLFHLGGIAISTGSQWIHMSMLRKPEILESLIASTNAQKTVKLTNPSAREETSRVRNLAESPSAALSSSASCGSESSFSFSDENKLTTPQLITDPAPAKDSAPSVIELHAHWGLLIRNTIKPVVFFFLILTIFLSGTQYHWQLLSYKAVEISLIAAALFFAVWIIYAFFEWANNRFRIESDCVKDLNKKPFAKEDINIAMMQKIQSVRFKKNGLAQMILNYGTVYILAGENELSFDYVPQPQKVQQQILDACTRFEEEKTRDEESRENARLDRLAAIIQKRPSSAENEQQ